MLTVDEFAEKIKTKYPAYKDMDNLELSQKIVDKYPEYKSQVNFEITESKPEGFLHKAASGIKRFGGEVAQGFNEGDARGEEIQASREKLEREKAIPKGGPISTLVNKGLEEVAAPVLGALGAAVDQPVIPAQTDEAIERGENPLVSLAKGNTERIRPSEAIGEVVESVPQAGAALESLTSKFNNLPETQQLALKQAGLGLETLITFVGGNAASKSVKKAVPDVKKGFVEGVGKGTAAREALNDIAQEGADIARQKLNARRLNDIVGLEEKQMKLTNEILQTPITELRKTSVGINPRGVEEAAKVIKEAGTFKEVDSQLKNVADSSIARVNALIAQKADAPISKEYLTPLKAKIDELSKDATKDAITRKYKQILEAELKNLENVGPDGYTLLSAQERKLGLNRDLAKFFNKKDPSDLEIADQQARDLIREGFMKEIERVGGKEIGKLNNTYGGLSDARSWLAANEAKFQRGISVPKWRELVSTIPVIKQLVKGNFDNALPSRASSLDILLKSKTKDLAKARAKAAQKKQKVQQ